MTGVQTCALPIWLRLKLSQKEFALRADIPLRTYKRFEQNCNGNFDNFINVLRAFDKLRILEAMFMDAPTKSRLNVIERTIEIKMKLDMQQK